MKTGRIDGAVWRLMTSDQKLELVRCYEQDLADAAATAGTSIPQQESQFVDWLDVSFKQGHITYYTGRVDGVLVTVFRTHDDEVPGEVLIEGLQTVTSHQSQGFARRLLRQVLADVPARYCADVHQENLASRATMQSAGFIQTSGPVPNHDRWRSSFIPEQHS